MRNRLDVLENSNRTEAARKLIGLLTPLSLPPDHTGTSPDLLETAILPSSRCREILSAIQALAPTLIPDNPVFATFHDEHVHDPLGGGSYAFQDNITEPILLALKNDETIVSRGGSKHPLEENSAGTNHRSGGSRLLTRPIIIHAGVQPNNSPHAGTLVVLCYAFSLARGIRDRIQLEVPSADSKSPPPVISVNITFVDTAPVEGQGYQVQGIHYQTSHRDVTGALDTYMADYKDVLYFLSTWSNVPYHIAFQSDFFSHHSVPKIIQYIVSNRDTLGRQLSPKYGSLALRAACPAVGCGLAEKHGRLNLYNDIHSTITFHCPDHGPHALCMLNPAEVARIEANAITRNLIRSMSHLLDDDTHHVRITGADYAGTYQEMFLYRPLAAWSAATGLAVGRTPHILYAPLIVDWSGAKLSKSLYVREGGYGAMKLLGTDGLCSYAQLKTRFNGNGAEGLRRIWDMVRGWVVDPRKLFRTFSVDYLQKVIMEDSKADQDTTC